MHRRFCGLSLILNMLRGIVHVKFAKIKKPLNFRLSKKLPAIQLSKIREFTFYFLLSTFYFLLSENIYTMRRKMLAKLSEFFYNDYRNWLPNSSVRTVMLCIHFQRCFAEIECGLFLPKSGTEKSYLLYRGERRKNVITILKLIVYRTNRERMCFLWEGNDQYYYQKGTSKNSS